MTHQVLHSSEKPYDVVVVGTGLSGLKTAVKIQRAGFSVVVLEAMDRVGGKTLSIQSSIHGTGINDLGAAWVNDSSQSEIFALFLEAGLRPEKQLTQGNTLRQVEDGSYVSVPFGQLFADEEEAAAFAVLFDALQKAVDASDLEDPISGPDAKRLGSLTFSKYCHELLDSPQTPIIANYLTRALLGVEGNEVSTLLMVNYLKSGTGIENLVSDGPDGGQYLRADKGMHTISKYLTSQLPAESVRLNTVVKSISQSPNGVQVATAANKIFKAKRVVVSIPSTLYPTISFSPELPLSKSILAEGTAIGTYSKVIIVRKEKVWEQFTQAFEGSGVLGGKRVPEPIKSHEIAWKRNQYADGAPTAVMGPGVLTELARVTSNPLREAWLRVHFVGTETSLVWKGYVDGAVRSGIRGGQEVVKALQVDQKADSLA
ncbi:putative amine oxidase [Triangularia verruculosa]|uniref:monoamine oxidase n=1 Tax=Triangularia verruculosa TaxID=2587418 RepID=A0AAN6X8R2_9PEZI|nr:putative amine oxidase [Triangularia verruculosa]